MKPLNLEKSTTVEEFLSTFPLYKKCEIEDTYINPLKWYGLKFQFHCEKEGAERTFKVVVEPDDCINESNFSKKSVLTKDRKLNYSVHVAGICQSCNQFSVHFLLNCYTDIPVDQYVTRRQDLSNPITAKVPIQNDDYTKYFVKKVGQLPAFSIKPDKEVDKFLNEVDKEYYKKAIICISMSYGIAAYSYLRRIVETEVIRIVEYLIKLEVPEKVQIQEAYDAYINNHQMDPFLKRIDAYLPGDLKELHENPLRLLYSELSMGIHEYQDEVCLKNAETTNELLIFIIKTLNNKKRYKALSDKLKDIGR